jgi:hypothetical protein
MYMQVKTISFYVFGMLSLIYKKNRLSIGQLLITLLLVRINEEGR